MHGKREQEAASMLVMREPKRKGEENKFNVNSDVRFENPLHFRKLLIFLPILRTVIFVLKYLEKYE